MLTHVPIFLISFPPTGHQIILSIVYKIFSYPWISFLNDTPQKPSILPLSPTIFLLSETQQNS